MRLRSSIMMFALAAAGLISACTKTFAQGPDPPAIDRPADPADSPVKAPSPPSDDGKRYF